MRGREVVMELSEMKLIEPPRNRNEELYISITEKGDMAFNSRLCEKLFGDDKKRAVRVYITDDMKIIAVQYDPKSDFIIPRDKRKKYEEFARKLEKKGYNVPAKYIVEWNEHMNAWVGVLREVAEAPQLLKKRKK